MDQADMIHITHITSFGDPALDLYARAREPQLVHWREPDPGIFIAESPKVIERALDAGYRPVSVLSEDRYIQAAFGREMPAAPERSMDPNAADPEADENLSDPLRAARVLRRCAAAGAVLYAGETELLKQITGYPLTRGLLAAMERKALPDAKQLTAGMRRIAVLADVENPTNVGAMFRSAAALGMEAVLLTPGCADPLYRRAARVSMGTVFQIPWTWVPDLEAVRAAGFETAAMALQEDTIDIRELKHRDPARLAVILGNEGSGLPEEMLAACSYTVKIPMSPGVDSLNVAAAAAVAFWELGTRSSALTGRNSGEALRNCQNRSHTG